MDKNAHNPVSDDQKPREHAPKSIKENPTMPPFTSHPNPQSVTIDGGNKNGHEGAGNTTHGLTTQLGTSKKGASMSVPTHAHKSATDYALQFLQFAARDYSESIDRREYYAVAARRLGISYQKIADIYGLTEGAIRAMVRRAGERS